MFRRLVVLALVSLTWACSDSGQSDPLSPSRHLSIDPAYVVPVSPLSSAGSWYFNGEASTAVNVLGVRQLFANADGKVTIQKSIDAISDIVSKAAPGRTVDVNASGGLFINSAGKYSEGNVSLTIVIVRSPGVNE